MKQRQKDNDFETLMLGEEQLLCRNDPVAAVAQQRTALYYIWQEIVDCTRNPRYKRYPAYGGRGIELYPAWCSFATFQIWALGAGCQKGYSLARYDPDGGFTPDNCCWVPPIARKPYMRHNLLSAFGETKSVRAWARDPRISVSHETIYKRLKSGWDVEMMLSTPPMPSSFFKVMLTALGETKSLSAWARDSRVSVSRYMIYGRLRSGWEVEKALITPSSQCTNTD